MADQSPPDPARPRTLIIGLDGATFDLIGPWIEAGQLPALSRMMAEGAHGPLPSWPNTNSAAAWSSIVTGYNAGQHGIFDFGSNVPQRGQRWRAITAADRRQPAFWRRLSDAGQCVGAINVPISYPAEAVHGFILGGMDSPGENSPGFCHPPGLYDELRRAGIPYAIDVSKLGRYRERDPYHMPDAVRHLVEARARGLLHLLQTYPWDAVIAVFTATDRMQHSFWPREPITADDPSAAPLLSLYQLLDDCVGQCVELAGPSATILVISDHGFGPARPAKRSLTTLFEQVGLMRMRGRQTRQPLAAQLMRLGRKMIPPSLQVKLAQARPSLRQRLLDQNSFAGIDWSGTQVFVDAMRDKIYVNLQGRQPEGIVPPEAYESVRARVRQVLLTATDPDSGRRLVRAVHDRETVYHGPQIGQAGDLIIEWDEPALGDAIRYEAGGKSAVATPPAYRQVGGKWQGTHNIQGIFVARGPGIRPGTRLANGHQYDITPTILHLQGQPVPADMNGRVLTEIFTDEWLSAHPVRQAAASDGQAELPGEPALEADEQELVEARLRDLGYIE